VFKVNFPAGRTGVQISGTVPGNMLHRYLVRALQGQTLIAEIFSVRNDVTLALYTEAGRLIHPEDSGISIYQWRLPANQEYRLEVIGPAADSDYRLVINIPRVVRFAVGTYGQSQTGAVSQGEVFLYRLRARQGQTMTLNLTPTNGAVALGVYGMESGDELLRPELGETSWSGVLPADTHYLVQVVGLGAGETNFGISFDIR
jgi:hypothetical protein